MNAPMNAPMIAPPEPRHTSEQPAYYLERENRQRGGILMKFTGFVLLLTILLVAGGIFYLGSADLPAPSATVKIPVDSDAIRPQ